MRKKSKNLVICHSGDENALWLFYALKEKGHDPELLNADSIPSALKWKYSLNSTACEWELWLPNKQKIHSSEVRWVINRLQHVTPYYWQRSAPDEYQYVAAEMHALCLSWLYTLSRQVFMLNPPGENTLSGRFFSQGYWCSLAAKAGLPAEHVISSQKENALFYTGHSGIRKQVLLIKETTVGAEGLPASVISSCKWLAKLSGNPLLEISLMQQKEKWIFEKADPFPAFKKFGNRAVTMLSEQLNTYAWY